MPFCSAGDIDVKGFGYQAEQSITADEHRCNPSALTRGIFAALLFYRERDGPVCRSYGKPDSLTG